MQLDHHEEIGEMHNVNQQELDGIQSATSRQNIFFFNDTATTEIYTLSLHDALPICPSAITLTYLVCAPTTRPIWDTRSEEHTSELQSPCNLVCRLLLEKKKEKLERNNQDNDKIHPPFVQSTFD